MILDGRLRDLGFEPWPGSDRWSIGGSTGRWVATRAYAGSMIELATPTLNALVAACRDLDRLTDPEAKP